MPSAEILTIGTEILLGEIIDTNARYIARRLREHGVDIYRTTSVGDNTERIALAIQEATRRADIIITTGGLGPTVDDPTRDAVAVAFGVKTEFRTDLWEQVKERFARFEMTPPENNRRQAFIPVGAQPIENPVGTAPAFLMDASNTILLALPGVPREMEYLLDSFVLPYLRERHKLTHVIRVRLLRTAGVGESLIDTRISDLERLQNPTVGLAAHSGQVDVRITAKAANENEAFALIEAVELQIRERLGGWIYGVDEDTLERVAMEVVRRRGWRLVALEAGLGGRLMRRLAASGTGLFYGEWMPDPPADRHAWLAVVQEARDRHKAEAVLGVALNAQEGSREIWLALVTPEGERNLRVPYGGPHKLAPTRAVNYALDLLRKIDQAETTIN